MRKKQRWLPLLMILLLVLPTAVLAEEEQPTATPEMSNTTAPAPVPARTAAETDKPAPEPSAAPETALPQADVMSAEEINALLDTEDYARILAWFQAHPEDEARFQAAELNDSQRYRYLRLYRLASEKDSREETKPGYLTYGSRPAARGLMKAAAASGFEDVVQSSAFVLGDGVTEEARKYVFNGDGLSGSPLVTCGINERNPVLPGQADERFPVADQATLWIPHVGTWYGEPVGMAVHLNRQSSGTGSPQSIMLQPGDWGTNLYYEDILDVTNTILLYRHVDTRIPLVNGTPVTFDTQYAVFAGSHGLTDEDLSWNGVHYRSSEASGPLTAGTRVYTDHLDWIAEGTSTSGRTLYYSGAERKTIRVTFDVSGQSEASFYLGVVTRGGAAEPSQDGGFDFNGWIDSASHSTFVTVDPNGGTYLGSREPVHHEGLPGKTQAIEASIRPGYVFRGYDLVQALGSWDPAAGIYTFGTPVKDGLKYGLLVARWEKIELAWSADKAVDLAAADIGSQLTYTIRMSSPVRDTAADAETMEIRDAVPAGTTFVSADQGGALIDGTVVWKLTGITRAAGATVSFTVQIDPDTARSPLSNQASFHVIGTGMEQNGTSNEVATELLRCLPQVTKTVDRATADLLDELTYTLTLVNTGKGTARSLTIRDCLPDGTDYIEGGTYDEGSRTVHWTEAMVRPGEQRQVSFRVRITADAGDMIRNHAVFLAEDAGGTIPEQTTSEAVTVLKDPLVTVHKSADRSEDGVDIGEVITWTLTVANQGEGTARFVRIVDPLPAGTSYVEGSVCPPGTCDPDKRQVEYRLEMLKPGETRTLSFQSRVAHDIEAPAIRNRAFFETSRIPAGPEDEDPVEPTEDITVPIRQPDLLVTKSADPPSGSEVDCGDILEYVLTIRNRGSGTSPYTHVIDAVPEGTELVAGSVSPACEQDPEGALTWLLKDIQPSGATSVRFKVRVTSQEYGAAIENVARWQTFRLDPGRPETIMRQPDRETNKTIHTTGTPAIKLVKEADPRDGSTVRKGNTIRYTLALRNEGTATARQITVRDILPEGTEISSSHPFPLLLSAAYDPAARAMTWQIDNLRPGAEVRLEFTAGVTAIEGRICNQASYECPPSTDRRSRSTPLLSGLSNQTVHPLYQYVPVVDTGIS